MRETMAFGGPTGRRQGKWAHLALSPLRCPLGPGPAVGSPLSNLPAYSTLSPNFLNFSAFAFSKAAAFALVITCGIPAPTKVSFGGC